MVRLETIVFFSTRYMLCKSAHWQFTYSTKFQSTIRFRILKVKWTQGLENRYSKAIYKLLLDYDKMQKNSSSTLLKCYVFTFAFLSRLSIEKASVMTSQPFIAILTPARDQNISDKNLKVASRLSTINCYGYKFWDIHDFSGYRRQAWGIIHCNYGFWFAQKTLEN